MKRKYEEVKADFYRLKAICNDQEIPDFCGSWCNTENIFTLLDSPSKKTASSLFSSLIDRYFSFGHAQDMDYLGDKPLDLMNNEIHEILVRNGNL